MKNTTQLLKKISKQPEGTTRFFVAQKQDYYTKQADAKKLLKVAKPRPWWMRLFGWKVRDE